MNIDKESNSDFFVVVGGGGGGGGGVGEGALKPKQYARVCQMRYM